tara:strand:+ start:1562 stop:1756 length:195 start_codon:yes stop_codon:yes gene_type:complete
MDGFDDCIVGILERFGIDQPIVVYDREKVIAKLMSLDHYYYNQVGGWHGEKTPAFLIKMPENEG